jgi:hypothetical protein
MQGRMQVHHHHHHHHHQPGALGLNSLFRFQQRFPGTALSVFSLVFLLIFSPSSVRENSFGNLYFSILST